MHLSLAGVTFAFADADAEIRRTVSADWPEFLDAQSPTSAVRLDVARTSRVIPDGSDPTVRVERGGGQARMERVDFTIDWDRAANRARFDVAGPRAFVAGMRVLLAEVLRPEGGVLFHASSVRVGSEALIFPGVSGTGKTTVAALGAPRPVLSDEISAVRVVGDRAVAYPTPFWGDMARVRAASAAPLRAVIVLSRGAPLALTEGTPAEAIAALLEGALVFGAEAASRDDKKALVGSVGDIVARTGCWRVRYALPADPWSLLDPDRAHNS